MNGSTERALKEVGPAALPRKRRRDGFNGSTERALKEAQLGGVGELRADGFNGSTERALKATGPLVNRRCDHRWIQRLNRESTERTIVRDTAAWFADGFNGSTERALKAAAHTGARPVS